MVFQDDTGTFGNDVGTPAVVLDQSTADAILKDVYSDDGITNEFFVDNPYFALMDKDENVPGRYFEQPVWAAAGQAQSRTAANAFTESTLTGEAPYTFLVPKVENLAVASISSKLIAESSSSKGAFVNMVRAIADNQMQQLINDTALGLFRTSVITRGQVGGSVSGATLTFQSVSDAITCELGMFLDFCSSNVVGGTLRALASNNTSCQITAIDYIGGTATLTWQGTGTQTLTANNVQTGDYILRSGDAGPLTGSALALGFNGFQDWIPYGSVPSTNFLGVPRTQQTVRLAGSWLDGTQANLEETLERAANQVSRFGGKLTHFIMPYGQFTALSNSQGAKVQLAQVKSPVGFGYEGIEVTGAGGKIVCLPDRYCPSNMIAGVNINSWKLISVGKICRTLMDDGKVWLRAYNTNGMQIRFYSVGNLVCREPRANIQVRVNSLV